MVFDIFEIENRELTQTALSTVLKTAGTFGYGGRHLNSLQLGKLTAIFILYFVMVEKKDKCFPFLYNVLKGQVLSPVKVCEESEATTNLQLYETKQMSFTIKLYLKNDTALTNTF